MPAQQGFQFATLRLRRFIAIEEKVGTILQEADMMKENIASILPVNQTGYHFQWFSLLQLPIPNSHIIGTGKLAWLAFSDKHVKKNQKRLEQICKQPRFL